MDIEGTFALGRCLLLMVQFLVQEYSISAATSVGRDAARRDYAGLGVRLVQEDSRGCCSILDFSHLRVEHPSAFSLEAKVLLARRDDLPVASSPLA